MNMKFKKRMAFVSMCAAAALVLSGCSDSDSDDNATDDTTVTTAGGVTGRDVKVAFSAPSADHGWTAAITTKAKAKADSYDDVEFIAPGGTADSAAQVDQVRTLIAQKPDVLVILPHDGEALTQIALEAMKAGIAVVNVDREFTDPAAARATIKGDNYGAGLQAGQYFAKQLNCRGDVVEIQGLAGISVTNQRTKGFADGIKSCNGGIRVIAQQPADFDPGKGQTVMENILQANKKIDAVYTHDDDMAEGVVRAIKTAGRDKEMFLTGVGGSKAAMDQIAAGGLYRATFLYNPSMAASGVSMGRLIAQGKGFSELSEPDVPNSVVLQAQGVFKENVEQYRSLAF
jgi:ribose transport system substrate-binding protein